MSVPEEKLQKIKHTCKSWLHRKNCTKKELQSLLGSLLYISKCIKAARIFLGRMLNTLRNNFADNIITLDVEFKKDLNWFAKLLPSFNGVSFFDKRPVKATIELDASLTGMGARFGHLVYALPITDWLCHLGIVHLEMINILLALKVWGEAWKNAKIIIKCDNQAVVSVLNTGRSRDMLLCAMARNILLQAATWDINLIVLHVLGSENTVADVLSRWFVPNTPKHLLYLSIPSPVWCKVHIHQTLLDYSI